MRRVYRLIAALFLLPAGSRAADHTPDPLPKVKDAVAAGKAVLIDVREPKEWDAGHLKDAKLLPLSRLQAGVPADELAKLIPSGTPAYLHCGSGVRCLAAADLLAKQGVDARALADGYKALLKAGFPGAAKK